MRYKLDIATSISILTTTFYDPFVRLNDIFLSELSRHWRVDV